jgi:preprotein translocase subunit SecA
LTALGARVALRFDFVERLRLCTFARQVMHLGHSMQDVSDNELKTMAAQLRTSLHREGITDALAVRGLAIASEASYRYLGKRPYPVQLMGAYGLLRGRLIEMATGEGKSLTAALPCLTLALAGVPVHIVSVNDYLARRDATLASRMLAPFGLSVGVITHVEDDTQKRVAYQNDVTYCVDKDLIFDYLRDNLRQGSQGARQTPCQRGLYFALIDEADSILIDEARTPLVIARARAIDQERADAMLALDLARQLGANHFCAEQEGRRYRLTQSGRDFLSSRPGISSASTPVWSIRQVREERVEQALAALHAYKRGSHYVVKDKKIQIVDESTGRILPDRSWQRGLHQMIELKEKLEMSAPRDTIARQTYPEFFSRYLRIAGMTGTAREVAGEIKVNFGMQTVAIPNHRPSIRAFLGVRMFLRSEKRWEAVASRATELAKEGRAVLIGTKSVLASEELSALLNKLGQPHRVLNALHAPLEAEIIAGAGEPGCVTVATNMAGRGTDINLNPQVRKAGGLHVILTEFHETPRVDRQLYGRAGRQGDPGSCEAIVSLEDELFRQFSPFIARRLKRFYRDREELPMFWKRVLQAVAQARAERKNIAMRRSTLMNDTAVRRAMAFAGAED